MPGLAQSGLANVSLSHSDSFPTMMRANHLIQSASKETLPGDPTPRRLELTPAASASGQLPPVHEQYPSPAGTTAPAVEPTPTPTLPPNPVLPAGAPATGGSDRDEVEGTPGETGSGGDGEEPEGTMYIDGTYWKTHTCNIFFKKQLWVFDQSSC